MDEMTELGQKAKEEAGIIVRQIRESLNHFVGQPASKETIEALQKEALAKMQVIAGLREEMYRVFICPLCFEEVSYDSKHCDREPIELALFLTDSAGWLAQREHELGKRDAKI